MYETRFIFKMPENTPQLTFASLLEWISEDYQRDLGTTVSIKFYGGLRTRNGYAPHFQFQLYDLVIAAIYSDRVEFTIHDDTHMATTMWLEKIVRDNGIGSRVGRIRRQKSDPLIEGPRGYCGPLAIDYSRNKLVEGHNYPVNSKGTV